MSNDQTATQRMFYREAIARALREEMSANPQVMILGQDVGAFGGSYREFDGLMAEFGPARVRDTPVAENATIGIAAGVAAAGYVPLVSITYMDFLMLGFDPLINYAAKLRYKTSGQLTAPMVVKTTAGALGQGVAHSQCIEAWLMGVPGLKIVAPSTPSDSYGLMKTALRTDGPVVFIDHKRLFPIPGDVAREPFTVPLGKAICRRRGSDVTISAHSYMVRVAIEAAERLDREGISCEVIDLRSLMPLDLDTLTESVGRTGRLVTLEEGQLTCGVGAEIACRVTEHLGQIEVKRVGALPAPVSSNPVFERACIPDAERVGAAISAFLSDARSFKVKDTHALSIDGSGGSARRF